MAGNGLRRFLSAIFWCLFLFYVVEYLPNASGQDTGHCIWYGVCSNEQYQKNCLYNGPAKPIQQDYAKGILQKYCPDIAAEGVSCCDQDQLHTLDRTVTVFLNILESSPSCVNNFLKHICAMHCASEHSRFLIPKKTAPVNSTHTMVVELDYYLDAEYMNATFDSCKDVRVPSWEGSALDLMCGEADPCTPQRWFDFMGDVKPYGWPFQINFISGEAPDSFTAYNPSLPELPQQ